MTDKEDIKSGDMSNVVDISPIIKRKNKKSLRNYYLVKTENGKLVKCGLDSCEIQDILREIVGDWPRSINGRLFIPPNGEIKWLDKAPNLFGWLSSEEIGIDWHDKAIEGITKSEFLEALRSLATGHKGFAKLPHFPPKPGYYYVPIDLPESGGAFEELLSFFNPYDPDLLKAAFMTLFWGGPSGARPAFVFTGPDDDADGGRGVGKTTLTDVMATLAGGAIDFSAKMNDIEQFKKRVLTSNGERVIRFDNVKMSRLSNGDIEAAITMPQISGHAMYIGNGTLPNDFTYLFTFNDVSFSKDMAQRAIPIKLRRPEYTGDWNAAVFGFLKEKKLEIIAGIRDAFDREPIQGTAVLRFGDWTKEVLNRATTRPDIVADIKQFQDNVDDDDDISDDIESIIIYQVSKYKVINYGTKNEISTLDVKGEAFFIRKGLLNQWVSEGLNLRIGNRAISKMIGRAKLKGFHGEREIRGYTYFIWSYDELLAKPKGGWKISEDAKTCSRIEQFIELQIPL
jgi:hypothetical protein